MKGISTTKCYTPTRAKWFGLQQYSNSKCWNTDSLQHTKNYQIKNFITNLQTTQVQNWHGPPPSGSYNAKEHNHVSLHASADQEVNREWAIPSFEESKSLDAESNQPREPGHNKIAGNQFVVAALLNKV